MRDIEIELQREIEKWNLMLANAKLWGLEKLVGEYQGVIILEEKQAEYNKL